MNWEVRIAGMEIGNFGDLACPEFIREQLSEFTFQKLEYMHQNSVMAEVVKTPEQYIYRGAMDYATGANKDYWVLLLFSGILRNSLIGPTSKMT